MASHRRPKPPGRTRVTFMGATAAAAVALTSQAANAAPQPNKGEVKAKVDKLYEEAASATEKYNGAKEQQDKLQGQVDAVQDRIARGQDELNTLRNNLGIVASAQYRSGGVDPSLQLLLSGDPDTYLDRAAALDRVGSRHSDAIDEIQEKRRALAQQRKEAQGKLTQLAKTREQLGAEKRRIQSKLSSAQKLLNSLTAKERAEIKREETRADRAGSTAERPDLGKPAAGSSYGMAAFAIGQGKIGSPYKYATAGPNTFDCSGFTSWSFAQAGRPIPRTSQAQANIGQRIYSQSQLKQGDLVFFYGDLHHVGFYAGNGQILHSPRTGAVVRYESINNMPFQFGVRV